MRKPVCRTSIFFTGYTEEEEALKETSYRLIEPVLTDMVEKGT